MQALRIVLIDDDDVLRDFAEEAFGARGHQVVSLPCAEDFDDAGAVAGVDVLVVDLDLPGEGGLDLVSRVRHADASSGIVIISGAAKVSVRVEGYRRGADIYLPKPFHPNELVASVEAVGRRVLLGRATVTSPAPDAITLLTSKLTLHGPAGTVRLSEADTRALAALARAPGALLERWQLVEVLREDPDTYSAKALEVRVGRIRRKLQQVGADGGCLRAVRGRGYQLAVPVVVR